MGASCLALLVEPPNSPWFLIFLLQLAPLITMISAFATSGLLQFHLFLAYMSSLMSSSLRAISLVTILPSDTINGHQLQDQMPS